MPMATVLSRVVACNEELPLKKLHDLSMTWACKLAWQIKYAYISTYTRSMAIKYGKVVTYRQGLLPIKLCNPLNTWLRGL